MTATPRPLPRVTVWKRIQFIYYTWPCVIGKHRWRVAALLTYCDRCYDIKGDA